MKARLWPFVVVLALSNAQAEESAPPEQPMREAASPARPNTDEVAPPDGYEIDERRVVQLALRDHPHVVAALADKQAADQAYRAARMGLVPDLQLSGRYTRLSSIPAKYRSFDGFVFPQLLNNFGARAQVVLPLSDIFLGLAASARALGKSAEASSLELVNARAQIAYEARVAFLSYWRATLALNTAIELTRAAETQVADQRGREAAGTVARNDVLQFEVALDAAVMAEQSARSDLASADATLRSFFPSLGERALRVPELPHDGSEAAPRAPRTVDHPPRIASLEAQAGAAQERAYGASLDRMPKLSLLGAGEVAAPSPRVFVLTRLEFIPTWEVGVRLEWSLSQATIGTAIAKREQANQRALVARVEEARRKIEAERKGALANLQLSHERARRAAERVQRAAALARARRGELEAGTALPLNVVLAETDLARAKNEHVDAVVERALTLAQLDFVDGRDAPSAPAAGVTP